MVDRQPLRDPAPEVQVEPILRAGAGSQTTTRVVVTNRCAEPRVLAITSHGVDAGWLPAPVRTRPVLPGTSVTVDLVLTPAIGTVPARYPLAVAVQALDPVSGLATSPTALAESTIVVDAPGEISLTLDPADTTGVFGRRVRVTVHNAGASPASVDLEVQTPASIRARTSARQIVVHPGRPEVVAARLRPHPVRMFGQRIRHAYTVTARSAGAPRHAAGSFTARAVLGPSATKVGALVAVVGVWLALAIVFVPKLADHFSKKNTTTVAQSAAPSSGTKSGSNGGGSGGSKSGSKSGSGGGSGGGGGKGGGKKSSGAGGAGAKSVQLSGTVTGNSPGQVLVTLTRTSLVAPKALGATTVGAPAGAAAFADIGMVPAEALHVTLPRAPQQQHVLSGSDGTWRLGNVPKPGFYELTFAKAGFETRRYIIDSTAAVAGQPLQVAMSPGQGKLSGTVRGPQGPVPGATVTITDGTVTISTTANSRGQVGQWSVDGLSTPDSYVVTATSDGLSTESALVNLGAGGSQSVGLTLHRGVVSLKGTISGRNRDGTTSGLAGAQITATSGNITRTATTVTPRGVKGEFILPDLPVGKYTITVSAPGYLPQTSRLTLHRGASRAVLNRTLTSATALIGGVISTNDGKTDPTGAGLVLTSATNTYKTTATSDPKPGSYAFDGVEPGTYVLSIQLFGFNTDTVTITVGPGQTLELDRTLQVQKAGVLPRTSHIQGQVLDARTGGPLTCDTQITDCTTFAITAKTTDQLDDEPNPSTFTATFLPSEQYTLPDPKVNPEDGLLPGLHTVTIHAPGYEDATVNVAVPLGGLITAPTVSLFPAPKIVGVITSAVDSPNAPTCVWAVSNALNKNFDPSTLPACSAETPIGCPAQSKVPGSSGITCANPENAQGTPLPVGNYTLPVGNHGIFTVYVNSADPEYQTANTPGLAVDGVGLNLPQGSVVPYSPTLHRLGRINVTVLHPGPNGDLIPVESPDAPATVNVDPSLCPSPNNPPQTTSQTDPNGVAHITRLQSNNYSLSASVPDTNAGGKATGCINVTIGLDQTSNVTLQLTHAVDAFVGRAVYNFNGVPTPISGATVQITGVSGYNGTSTILALWQMTSDAKGCFGIHSNAAPADSKTCPKIGEEGAPFVSDQTANNIKLQSNIISARISAPGFQDLVTDKQDVNLSTVTDFTLTPNPATFTSGGGVNTLDVVPATDTPDWSQAHVTVAENDGLSHGITVSLTGTGSEAVLTWHDPTLQTNQVQPGAYTLTATLPGYQTATTTLTCTAGASATCTMSPAFTLTKLATLTMTTNDADGPVDGATFTLTDNGNVVGTPVTAASDSDTPPPFTGLTPGDANLRVAIQAAGYRFTTASALNYALVCDGNTVTSIPAPAAGATVACTATLERLGSISGTVTGIQAISPATSPNSPIGGATVTIRQCDTVVDGPDGTPYCTARTSGGKSFTTTAAASTDPSPGTFTITGTNTLEGLTEGAWLITATAPGYCPASTTANTTTDCPATLPATVVDKDGNNQTPLGIAVQLATDNTDASQSLTLYQRPARLVVTATVGGKPAIGLTLTLSGNNLGADVQATEETDKNNKLTGSYDFPPEVPGTYNLTASGDGFLTIGEQVPIAVGAPPFPLTVSRGTNTVTGTVTGLQNTDVTASDLSGVTVCIVGTASGTCDDSNDVLSGVDGTALTTTTGDDGTFAFTTNVPDTPAKSSYFIVAEEYGYVPFVSAAFTVKHTGPATHDEQINMTRVTWTVVVTVTASSSDDDLSSAASTAATFKSAAGGNTPDTAPTNSNRPETASADPSPTQSFTVTDSEVPYGCWTFSYLLNQLGGGDHLGTLSRPTANQSDDNLNCSASAFTVPGTPAGKNDEVDVAITLREDELDLTVNATALAPDTVPAIEIAATNSKPKVVYDNTFDAVTDTTNKLAPILWVPDDDYSVQVTVSDATGAWPTPAPRTVTVPGSPAPAKLTFNIREKTATLTVNVDGATKKTPGTVTITCIDSQTVPTGCDSGLPSLSDTGSGVTFTGLAPGTWHVEATLGGNTVTQDITIIGGGTPSITLPNANSTPTAFPTPTPSSSATPSATDTPTSSASPTG